MRKWWWLGGALRRDANLALAQEERREEAKGRRASLADGCLLAPSLGTPDTTAISKR
jgi:hypothetical protein